MSERLNQILNELISTMNSTLFWGPQGFRRQSQDMMSYYDPRYATGWEDYTTHQSIGAVGPPATSIGSSIPIEGYGLTNKKVEEQEDEEIEHDKLATEQPVPLQQPPSVGQFEEEEEEKEEEEKIKKSDLADIREQPEEEEEEEAPPEEEPMEEPAEVPEEPPMGEEDMPGEEDMGGFPGMPGEEETGPETPGEVGRIYELKKIYSRLISIDKHLAESTDSTLLKLRQVVGQSIEVFEVMIANIDLFKEQADDIIVLYYEFLERVYGLLKKYYSLKKKEDTKKDKKDAETTDKPEGESPEFGPQSSENPMYNKL